VASQRDHAREPAARAPAAQRHRLEVSAELALRTLI